MLTAAVIVAAGRGHRLGGEIPKQYAALGDSCALRLCVDRFLALDRIDAVQLVIHPDDRPLCTAALTGLHDSRLLPHPRRRHPNRLRPERPRSLGARTIRTAS